MTNANLRLLLLAGAAVGAAAAAAQTSSTTAHHTASTVHHTAARSTHPACAVVPTLSPKIPALADHCARALFTVSERLDYISPLVGPEVRAGFSNLPMSFTVAYIDERVGTGEVAKPHMWYTVQYTGYLPDGTKFDSSLDHPGKEPITFPYGAHRVIPGWDVGFEGMHIGGKRRLFIPYQLAYGERGHPPTIPPKSELVFDMELISQSAEPPASKTPPVPPRSPTPPTGVPGQPGSLPSTPPTGTAPGGNPNRVPGSSNPSSPSNPANPQTGPDVKPAPPTPGAPNTPPQPPPGKL